MGTNYYHEIVLCEHCGNSTREHIGKSSGGWSFSFQALPNITSYTEWLKVLETGGRIVDEYGDVVPLDDFKSLVERKCSEKHNHAREYPNGSFIDPEGHSFSWNEFS